MPFDSQIPFDPTDPAQWARIRALPHIVVSPKPPPDAPAPDGIDDWFVPWQATEGPNDWVAPGSRSADGYPDDWIAPPPAALGTGQLSSARPPNAANSASFHPALPPDPFAAYWSTIPASRVGAMAWDPPNLPLYRPSPSTNNSSPARSPGSGPPNPLESWPQTLGSGGSPWPFRQSLSIPAIPEGGLLGGLAALGPPPSLLSAGGWRSAGRSGYARNAAADAGFA
jgi:hypothetical protein